MKSFIAVVFALAFTQLSLSAQTVWKGGTPGQEQNWNTPQNWLPQSVPGDFDNVFIPDLSGTGEFYPEINEVVDPIQHLEIESNAHVKIGKYGSLVVDGANTYNYGILNHGTLNVDGELNFINIPAEMDLIAGQGRVHQKRARFAFSESK